MGAVAGDVDGDGDQDLYATNLGADALLVNDGRARFRSPADNGGIRDERWTTGATFFDADADGDLDLFVTGYLEVDFEEPIWCGRQEPGWRSYCHPDRYAALQDRFWRNRGDGSFADETERAGFADSFGKGLGVIASDFDADGDQDLYVANDSTENRLWRNAGDGTFADDTLLSGTGVNEHGASEAGMGLATGDVDGDGDIDVLVSNLDHESNTLYRNLDGVLFEDATTRMGLEAPSRMFVGFGLVLEDFDQDGDLDLAVANGHIIDNIALYDQGQTWAQRGQLFVNDGRTLRENALAGGPLSGPFVARGLYAGDLDGDGHPDLLLTQCNAPARVFRNVRAGRGVTLRGLPQGARVTARTREGRALAREVGGRISYFGQGSDEVVLGLGAGDAVTSLSVREVGKEPVDVGVPEGLDGVRRLRRVGGGWELE
jgi:hypothetical protein